MRIQTVLEAVSSIVYHMAGFGAAAGIAKSNSLNSRSGEISFTRSMTGAYHKDNKLIGIIYEVDGQKLNQRYKGKPVGTEDFATGEYSGRANRQLEDRIYAKSITNFSKYIRNVYFYIPLDYLASHENEFDEHYSQELNNLPEVVSLMHQKYGDLRFILSERDLHNKRYYGLDVAKKKISKAVERYNHVDDLSKEAQKFFGIDTSENIDYRLLFEVRLECDGEVDGECDSDHSEQYTKYSKLENMRWDVGYSDIPFDGNLDNLEKTLNNVNPDIIAKHTISQQGESNFSASDILSYHFDGANSENLKTGEENNYDNDPRVKRYLDKSWYNF